MELGRRCYCELAVYVEARVEGVSSIRWELAESMQPSYSTTLVTVNGGPLYKMTVLYSSALMISISLQSRSSLRQNAYYRCHRRYARNWGMYINYMLRSRAS